jgi:hypothetical protein
MMCIPAVLALAVVLAFGSAGSSAAQDVLRNAHAHNDYAHARPLDDALEHGFVSVEADVHLVNDTLFVAHDLDEIQPGRTLKSLYLDPLRERIYRNGGRVYPDGPPLLLLIDVKSEAAATYDAVRSVLRRYADILTLFAGEEVIEGAVTAIVSGNRARDAMLQQDIRFAAYDGRPEDLALHSDIAPAFIPLVSSSWSSITEWKGDGPMPEAARTRLREMVGEAHRQGRMFRFWATPDTGAVWDVLLEEDVDLIGADDLGALRDYLL